MPPKRPSEGGQPPGGDATKRARMVGADEDEGGRGGVSSIQAQIEAAKARAAAALLASKSAASKAAVTMAGSNVRPSMTAGGAGNALNIAAIQKQLEEAKRKLNLSAVNQTSRSSNQSAQQQGQRHELDRSVRSAIHPLLMDTAANRSKPSAAAPPSVAASSRPALPKEANAGAAPVVNPYLSSNADDDDDDVRNRFRRRALLFNAPGRHIRAAEEARREAQMEALKRRIEEQARKAGLEELSAEERALRRQKPPGLEWWDQQFLPGQETYEAVFDGASSSSKVLLIGDDSPIDAYIQHPIPLPAPSDKIKVEMKGVMLTKREQKKMRRLRRRAEQEDKQDQIKMGLLPPDPPKVKLGNLMRVLTSEAVADPTKVEARVRRDVAARREKHDLDNHERMLTPEQRKAKADEHKEKDLAKGVYTLVFKIRHLVSPSHKFKVNKNARQLGLTGLALFGKDFALVLVEGGHKGIKSYRHLMMERIKWHDPGRPKAADGGLGSLFAEVDGNASSGDVNRADAAAVADGEGHDDDLAHINWSENYCRILFEGPIRDQHFSHGFRARQCEADIDAKQALGPKMASYWDLAKRDERATEEGE